VLTRQNKTSIAFAAQAGISVILSLLSVHNDGNEKADENRNLREEILRDILSTASDGQALNGM
jgi:hypothetical protein